jgi:hypothetical protein
MGRAEAQPHGRLSSVFYPHCLSGDIIQPRSFAKGELVNQAWISHTGNRPEPWKMALSSVLAGSVSAAHILGITWTDVDSVWTEMYESK